jgi:hypothetical protein
MSETRGCSNCGDCNSGDAAKSGPWLAKADPMRTHAPVEFTDPRGPIVWGLKSIGAVMSPPRSVDYVRARMNRDVDPLTVFWQDDVPGIYVGMLRIWEKNQQRAHKYHVEIQRLQRGETGKAA